MPRGSEEALLSATALFALIDVDDADPLYQLQLAVTIRVVRAPLTRFWRLRTVGRLKEVFFVECLKGNGRSRTDS